MNRQRKPPIDWRESNIARRICIDYARRAFPSRRSFALVPLTESSTTQAYLIRSSDGKRVVVKRHCISASFSREIIALTMFSNIWASPSLLRVPDADRGLLICEYLPDRFPILQESDIARVARRLGIMHGFANICYRHLEPAMSTGSGCLRDWLDGEKEPERSIAYEMSRVLGRDYTSVAIGDVKPEHVRLKMGRCALVDLETFSWGGIEVVDLLSLTMFGNGGNSCMPRYETVSKNYYYGRNWVEKWPVLPEMVERWICMAREALSTKGVAESERVLARDFLKGSSSQRSNLPEDSSKR